MTPRPLVLVGGGGHASDVLGVVEASNRRQPTFTVLGLVDDGQPSMHRFRGRGIGLLGPVDVIAGLDAEWVIAVGDPTVRAQLAARMRGAAPAPAARLVHPLADIGFGVELGEGVVVLGQCRLSANVELGEHCSIGYASSVGHEARVGACTTVMPGAIVSGDVEVGRGVLVGAGSVILEGRVVGDGAVVGAGAVVTNDVAPHTLVVGVPARPVP